MSDSINFCGVFILVKNDFLLSEIISGLLERCTWLTWKTSKKLFEISLNPSNFNVGNANRAVISLYRVSPIDSHNKTLSKSSVKKSAASKGRRN